jgi:hypothetical protein
LYEQATVDGLVELGVLVGHFDGRESFICYDNPHAPPTAHQIMDDGSRALGHRANLELVVRDEGSTPLTITVTIAQRPEQTVLACKQIIITLPQRIVDIAVGKAKRSIYTSPMHRHPQSVVMPRPISNAK